MTLQIKKKQRRILLLSFLLPLFLSTLALFLKGVSPFGDGSFLRRDARLQYHPYLSLFRDTLLRGGSLEHTWSIGMGENFLPVIAYYLSSPLYLLSIWVPEAYLELFMLLLTVIKLSLAGLFFAVFLTHTYRSHDPMIPFFAVLYSLCAWSAGYYWCIIWLDVFALLPLLITGTLAMLRESRFPLYTLSLALSLWCNYYLTYCSCLFVLIAFAGYHICTRTRMGNFLKSFLRFGLCTLWAVALGGVLLLPALMGMQNTASAQLRDFSFFALTLPEGASGFSFPHMLEALSQVSSRTLANTAPTDLTGLPNMYTGFSALLFAFSFLWNKSFSRRDRLFHGLLLLFLAVSCIFKITDYIWHGFHFPNMLPARFSFLFSFTVLTMAFRGYSRIPSLGIPRLLCTLGCGIAVLLLGFLHRKELSLGYYALGINLLILVGAAAVMVLRTNHRCNLPRLVTGSRLSVMVLILLFTGEAFLSFYSGVKAPMNAEQIADLTLSGQQLYEAVAAEDPELFYRTEASHGFTPNDGALHHYNGVDVFSSAALVNHGNLASALGLHAAPENNSTTYLESTPFTNTLCGIKYLISEKGKHLSPETDPLIASLNGYEIRRLPSYIGVGFMTSIDLAQFEANAEGKNPFEEQGKLFRLATGLDGELYRVFYGPELHASSGCSLEYTGNESQFLYTVPGDQSYGEFTLRYTMEEAGLLSVATRMQGGEDMSVYRNGELLVVADVSARAILSLGHVAEGDVIELVYTSQKFKQAGINTYMAIQNDDLFRKGMAILSDEVWDITYADDTTLKGTITTLSDGLFYSSIPYEPGWTVAVDGIEVPIARSYDPQNPNVKLTDGQICFPLSAGSHEITMTYEAPGLRTGLCLSAVSLLLFLLTLLRKKKSLLPELIPTVKENPNE